MAKNGSLEDSGRCLIGFAYTHDLEDTPKVDNNTNKSQYLSCLVGIEEEQLFSRLTYRNFPQLFSPPPHGREFVGTSVMRRELFRRLLSLGGLIVRD